jgi:hypothetical protein
MRRPNLAKSGAGSCSFKEAITLYSLQQKLEIHKFAKYVANKEKTMRMRIKPVFHARGAKFFFVF